MKGIDYEYKAVNLLKSEQVCVMSVRSEKSGVAFLQPYILKNQDSFFFNINFQNFLCLILRFHIHAFFGWKIDQQS